MDALNRDAPWREETFTANRAAGRIAVSVAARAGASRLARVHEAGSLRVRFPNSHDAGHLDAVIVNTAGGMTGGDKFSLGVTVGADAKLTVTTAAAEKIYRSLGPDTDISVKLAVGRGASVAWLPQETIMFDRARLCRTIDVDLAAGATLLLAELLVFGRSAMGETMTDGRVFDRWRVRTDGVLSFAETMRLDGAMARQLAQPAVAAGNAAIASILKIPGDEAALAAIRTMQDDFAGEVGVSAWNGLAVARLIAPDGAALRRDLLSVLTAWGDRPLPRLWLN